MNLTERIDAAIERASKNMPGAWVNQLDPEMVLGECKRRIEKLERAIQRHKEEVETRLVVDEGYDDPHTALWAALEDG